MQMRTILVALAVALSPAWAGIACAGPEVTPLVSTEWLDQHRTDRDVAVLDTRTASDFEAAHIPGAISTAYPGHWRNPDWTLPDIDVLAAYLSDLGIDETVSIVVIPAGTGSTELGGSTWIYWVLKYLGHDQVAILDGGWQAWHTEAKLEESGIVAPHSSLMFTAVLQPEIRADTDQVAAQLGTDTAIVDARPPGEYRGEAMSPLVVRAGHIPGAVNLPTAELYDLDANRFKSTADLTALLPSAVKDGPGTIVVYCNTGHWSSLDWFALHELLGYNEAVLYDGSMAAWTRTDLPLKTGPDP